MAQTITPAELHARLTVQPNLALLDVRTAVEFEGLHVPQARNVPLTQLDPKSLGLPAGEPVYLLCRTGTRADLAAGQLAKAGYAEPIVVTGGTQAWEQAGLPVTRGTSRVISLERQVRIAAGSLVILGIALAYFVHPYLLGLSAFVGAGLVFAGITDYCGMGLLLAKLPWNNRKPV